MIGLFCSVSTSNTYDGITQLLVQNVGSNMKNKTILKPPKQIQKYKYSSFPQNAVNGVQEKKKR